MNKKHWIYLISFYFLQTGCSNLLDCNQLPAEFSNYEEALQKVKAAHFLVEESVNTSKSSWIRGASYKSCDGQTGYFILRTDSDEYIHSDVSIENWKGFQEADSYGSYYNQYIK
jgi:hypothetical protein